MSDDLDDLLRRAMKTLDDQVPSGYFEGLPNRAMARLEEGSSMQTTGTMGSDRNPSTGVPPQQDKREEDSGLHDIRNLASTTKARLSSRRSTQNPIVTDDVLASSSAGWKAVALPEPAKMVSLPELASLPTKREIEAKDKAEKQAREAKATEDAAVAKVAKRAAKAAPAAELPATEASIPSSAPMIGSRIASQRTSSGRGGTIALVGMGLAAAAGAVFYFGFYNKQADKAPAPAAVATAKSELPKMSAPMMAPPAPHVEEPTPVVVPETTAAAPVEPAHDDNVEAKAAEPKQKVHKVEIRDTPKETKPEAVKPEVKKDDGKKKDPDAGDPSFDQLLKEAGVSDQKKEVKVVLEKKSLSGADIKTGMSSVEGKAKACFAGTEGSAAVKLTVAPSGKVQKVSVSGVFAGTPVGACVEAAVKSASFPPWDGGPQSFGYSYLLAE